MQLHTYPHLLQINFVCYRHQGLCVYFYLRLQLQFQVLEKKKKFIKKFYRPAFTFRRSVNHKAKKKGEENNQTNQQQPQPTIKTYKYHNKYCYQQVSQKVANLK